MLNKSYIKYMIMFIFKYKLFHVANARGSSHALLTNSLHLSSSIFPLLCILIIVRIIYIYSANLPNPCGTDLPSVTNFPQLSPTYSKIFDYRCLGSRLFLVVLAVFPAELIRIPRYPYDSQVSVWCLTKTLFMESLLSFWMPL